MHNFFGCFQGFFSMEKINIKRPSFFLVVILYCTCVPTFSSHSINSCLLTHYLSRFSLCVEVRGFLYVSWWVEGGGGGAKSNGSQKVVVFLLHDTYCKVIILATVFVLLFFSDECREVKTNPEMHGFMWDTPCRHAGH